MRKCSEALSNCLGKEQCCSILPWLTDPTVFVSLPIPLFLGKLRQLQTGERKGPFPRPAPGGLGAVRALGDVGLDSLSVSPLYRILLYRITSIRDATYATAAMDCGLLG